MAQQYSVFTDPPFLLRDYLLATLPAQIASLNTTRTASFVSGQPGPFVIPSGAVLQLATQNDALSNPITWHNVPLTAGGAQTSAQVVTDLTNAAVPHFVPSVDSLGRVSFASDTAPVNTNPATKSLLLLNADTTGANIALGLPDGGRNVKTQPLNWPSSNEFYSYEHPLYKLGGNAVGGVPGVGSARYAVVDQRVKPDVKGVKSYEHETVLRLEIADQAEDATEILERVRMYARAVQECLAADRHFSTVASQHQVVFSQVIDYHPQTKIFQFRGGGMGLPVGFEYMDILIRFIDPNAS